MSETMDPELYKKYTKAAKIINGAGGTPLKVGDTLIKILRHILPDEEALGFIKYFKTKTSQTMEQLIETSGLSEEEILPNLIKLAKIGLIFNQPNRKGLMVFRLMPFVNVGIFEYTYMKKLEETEENKEIARLFQKLKDEGRQRIQANYDAFLGYFKQMRPIDRTIPYTINKESGNEIEILVDEELEAPEEKVVPTLTVEELIEKFKDIMLNMMPPGKLEFDMTRLFNSAIKRV